MTSKQDNWYFYVIALRPYQWVKNFLIFMPLLFSHTFFETGLLIRSFGAFVAFSATSSSVYLLNDLMDFKKDQIHPIKKLRPLASGKVSPQACLLLSLMLCFFGLVLGLAISPGLALVLCVYTLSNVLYSKYLKHMVIVDVMFLGLFFILRVLAGAVAIDVELSSWLIVCTGLLALFLGFNKRRHELKTLGQDSGEHRRVLKSYSLYFIDQMISVLTASTVVFYTLYTMDERTVRVMGSSHLLWTVPFVYYGIFRYLYLVHKRGKGGDPTRIVMTDDKMIINLVLWVATCFILVYYKI